MKISEFNDTLLKKMKNGEFKGWQPWVSNLIKIFCYHPDWTGVLSEDERNGRIYVKNAPVKTLTDCLYSNNFISEAREWLIDNYLFNPSQSDVDNALTVAAHRNRFDKVTKYLNGLEWDHVPRLDSWLTEACGVDSNVGTNAIAQKWMISAVARQLNPGCKVDTLLILQGSQGLQKSTLLSTLCGFPEYYSDDINCIDGKDGQEKIQGPFIVEFAEIDKFWTRSSAANIKTFISTTYDRFRPAYARTVIHAPRRCVFVGTTNKDEFLRDATGGRRFWPVQITKCDVNWIAKNRDQLWAEAVCRYKSLTSGPVTIQYAWWLSPDEENIIFGLQEQARLKDSWEDLLLEFVENDTPDIDNDTRFIDRKRKYITMTEIWRELGVETSQQSRCSLRVHEVITALGWKKVGRISINGRRVRAVEL